MSKPKYEKNDMVNFFLGHWSPWQQGLAKRIRDLVHEADPDVTEQIKRTSVPFFMLDGNICALLAAKDHLNIFIYDPIAPDPEHIINQGQGNKTARAIRLYKGDELNEPAFLELIKAVVKNNRAGGWRKLSQ